MNRAFFLCFVVVSFNSIHETDEMYRAGQGCRQVLKQLGKDFISNELQNTGNSWIKNGGSTTASPTTRYRRPLSDPGTSYHARRYSSDGISETVSSMSRLSLVEEVEKRGICARRPEGPLKKSHTCASFFDKEPSSLLPCQSLEEGGLVHHGHHHHHHHSPHHPPHHPPHYPPHPHHHQHHQHHGPSPCPSARVVVQEENIIFE